MLAARPGRAQWGQRADALPGRAGGDQPYSGCRREDRRRAGADPLAAAAARRGRARAVSRAGERRRYERGGHRFEELTPPLPGQRADVSLHTLKPGATTGGRGTRRSTSRAAARPPSCSTGALALVVDGTRHELRTGDSVTFDADLPHHFENEGEEPARFLAVIAAGLRRS